MLRSICCASVAAMVTMNACGQSTPCRQKSLQVKISGGETLKLGIGGGLELNFDPYKNHMGWMVRVSPRGSSSDWSYPVTLPLDGEAQCLGSGWGRTAEDRLQGSMTLKFAINLADFTRYSKLADDALHSSGGDFISQLKQGTFGTVVLSDFQHETEGTADSISWAKFTAMISIPGPLEDRQDWQSSPCDTVR
jgi:hypothetical protein